MRGKHNCKCGGRCCSRITPADAGKTEVAQTMLEGWKDHPRGCGENRTIINFIKVQHGSPPRMRGKLPFSEYISYIVRITPADAGKTADYNIAGVKTQDHPRGCGENVVAVLIPSSISGSPPRMRGKLRKKTPIIIIIRITPADAGKTLRSLDTQTQPKDHPRGCGENFQKNWKLMM